MKRSGGCIIMKRTKPTKSQKEILDNPPNLRFGGHMPYPPENCPATKCLHSNNPEIEFIDCTSCGRCRFKKSCKRLKEYEREWKEYWNKYRKIKGVNENENENN